MLRCHSLELLRCLRQLLGGKKWYPFCVSLSAFRDVNLRSFTSRSMGHGYRLPQDLWKDGEMNTYTWVWYHDYFLFLFFFLLLGCTWYVYLWLCSEYMCWRFIPPTYRFRNPRSSSSFFSRAYLHTPVAYKIFLSPVALPNPSHTSLALLAFPQFESGEPGGFQCPSDGTRRSVSLHDVFEALFDAFMRWVAYVNELFP